MVFTFLHVLKLITIQLVEIFRLIVPALVELGSKMYQKFTKKSVTSNKSTFYRSFTVLKIFQ